MFGKKDEVTRKLPDRRGSGSAIIRARSIRYSSLLHYCQCPAEASATAKARAACFDTIAEPQEYFDP
jgi:hypothetical protein